MMQDVANKIKELEAERSKYLRQVAELLLVLEDTEKERDEAGAEAKRLKEILQGLVKNRNRAMQSGRRKSNGRVRRLRRRDICGRFRLCA